MSRVAVTGIVQVRVAPDGWDVIGFIKGGMVAFTSACRHQADTLDYDGRVL